MLVWSYVIIVIFFHVLHQHLFWEYFYAKKLIANRPKGNETVSELAAWYTIWVQHKFHKHVISLSTLLSYERKCQKWQYKKNHHPESYDYCLTASCSVSLQQLPHFIYISMSFIVFLWLNCTAWKVPHMQTAIKTTIKASMKQALWDL